MKKWLCLVVLVVLAFTLLSLGSPPDLEAICKSGRRGVVPQSSRLSSDQSALKVGKKDEISLPDKVRVGVNVLQGGRYLVRCEHKSVDDHEMVFARLSTPSPFSTAPSSETREQVRVQCRVQPIGGKVERTSVIFAERDGERFVEKIRIQGENVEHLFD